jgi:hypothetical protein
MSAIRTAAAESQQYDFINVGGWTVNAIGDADGFGLCVAASVRESDTRLVFGVSSASDWHISLINEKWQLQEGGNFQLEYAIDGAKSVPVSADAVGKIVVMMRLEGGMAAIEPFKRASRLRVFAAKQTFIFDLAGSRAALEAAYDCMLRNSGQRQATTDPFSAAPAQDPFSAPQADAQASTLEPEAEAMLVGTVILRRIGQQDARVMGAGEDVIDGYQQTWRLARARAGVLVLDGLAREETGEFLQNLEDKLSEACPAPTLSERPIVSRPILGRLRFSCGLYASAARFFVLPRPRGGLYVFLVMGDPDPEGGTAADALDDKIAAALVSEPWPGEN